MGGPQDYWLVKAGPDHLPGIDGGLHRRYAAIDGQTVIAYVCTVTVTSVDECILKAQNIGATLVVPKMLIPGVGWLAYCKDTEGSIFGMMQSDPTAPIIPMQCPSK